MDAPTEAPAPGVVVVPVPVPVTIPTADPVVAPTLAPVDPTVTLPPVDRTFPEVISLGTLQPGGLTAQGDEFYVANQLFGGIRAVDVGTGEVGVLTPNTDFLNRLVFGLDSNATTLYAAGSDLVDGEYQGRIFAFNSETGEELAACGGVPDFYPTDVAVQGDSVYATNSLGSNLIKLDAVAASRGECMIEFIDLPPEGFGADLADDEVQGTSVGLSTIRFN